MNQGSPRSKPFVKKLPDALINEARWIFIPLKQRFLNLLEVPNPASFMLAFTEPFVEIQNISVDKLEPKVNYASVADKILLLKERKRTKQEFNKKTQLNKYLLQINAFYAVAFQKQF